MRRWKTGALALCLAAAACTSSSEADQAQPATTQLTFPETTAASDQLSEALALEELFPVASGLRELEFLEPLEIQVVDDEEYARRVEALVQIDERRFDPEERTAWARLFGLVPDGTDLDSVRARLLATTVAIYDPINEAITVRIPFGVDPYVESIVVHEMVHALHDQNFERPPLPELLDDPSYVRLALEEGDATRIERQFLTTLSQRQRGFYERGRIDVAEEATPTRLATPEYLIQATTRPFADGIVWLEAEDNRTVDDLFRGDPGSSEQILHRDPFDSPIGVAIDPVTVPGFASLPPYTLGEAQLRLLLAQGVGEITARVAAVGWGGDRLQVQVMDADVLFTYRYQGDSIGDAEELATAFRLFLDRQLPGSAHGSVRINRDEVLVIATSDADLAGLLDEQFDGFGVEVFSEPE